MRKHVIKPVEPLILVFPSEIEGEDDKEFTAMFGNAAFLIYANKYGDINKALQTEAKEEPYKFAAKLLYCGLKVAQPTITEEEAYSMMILGGEYLLDLLMGHLIDNFLSNSNDEVKKKFLTEMEKELKKAEKSLLS